VACPNRPISLGAPLPGALSAIARNGRGNHRGKIASGSLLLQLKYSRCDGTGRHFSCVPERTLHVRSPCGVAEVIEGFRNFLFPPWPPLTLCEIRVWVLSFCSQSLNTFLTPAPPGGSLEPQSYQRDFLKHFRKAFLCDLCGLCVRHDLLCFLCGVAGLA
jgi:hypothetical protein